MFVLDFTKLIKTAQTANTTTDTATTAAITGKKRDRNENTKAKIQSYSMSLFDTIKHLSVNCQTNENTIEFSMQLAKLIQVSLSVCLSLCLSVDLSIWM